LFSTYRSSDKTLTEIKVSIWGTLSASSFSAFTEDYFSKAGLKYSVSYSEKNPTTFDRDLVEAIASGVGPDAIILPSDLIVRFANKIYNIPYASLPELTFKQTFIQEGELYLTSNGVMALPFSIDPLVMYWNRDIFNNVGITKPPVSWTEVISLVPKMTKKDQAQNIITSAVAFGEYRNIINAKEILSALLIQTGNPIINIDSDGTFSSVLGDNFGLDTSPASLALQFYTSFSNPSRPVYSWNRSLINSLDMFTNGDLAMYFGFASEYSKIKEKNPNLNFDVAILPQISGAKTYSTTGKMLGFAIMKNSSNPAGTYTVLSSLVSAAAVPSWTNIFNLPSARRDILSQADKSAIKTVFNQSAIMSKGWYDPNSVETGAIFQDMVESYTTGRQDLSSVISVASSQLNSLLGK